MADAYHSLSDADLVRQVLAGDRRAYDVLVDRHLPAVFGVIRRIVSRPADAEDVTQDTFVRAYQRLEQYQSAYVFRNWLLRVATTQAINHLRSLKRERLGRLRIAREQTEAAPEPEEPAPTQAEWEPLLAKLDEDQRTAIVLFHFEDLSYNEVAEVMGIPLNTVKTLLHRGRKRLREILSRQSQPEGGVWNVAI